MRSKLIGEIQEPMRTADYLKGMVSRTEFVILHMEDGSIIQYDLLNPKIPLPSWRAVIAFERTYEVKTNAK